MVDPIQGRHMSVRTKKIALGSLEIAILEYLWEHGAAEVKSVAAGLLLKRRVTGNTVQSAMERLFRKGFLARQKVSHAYVYNSKVSHSQVISRVIGEVLDSFSPDTANNYLLAFVDYAADVDEDSLDALEALIKRKRLEKSGSAE